MPTAPNVPSNDMAAHLFAIAVAALEGAEGDALWAAACDEVASAVGARWVVVADSTESGELSSRVGTVPRGTRVVDAGGHSPRADRVVTVVTGDGDSLLVAGFVGAVADGEEHAATRLRTLADFTTGCVVRAREVREVVLSEERLKEAQELARLGSYDWNILTDTNTWSDELYRIYGYEPGAFNASYERFLSMLHPDDRERIMGVHQRAMETHEPYRMEERIVRPDGEVRILDSIGKVVCDDRGNPIRMAGICLDVTDQRRAAERVAEADRRLAQIDERRRQALEINDNVVQGLSSVVYALEGSDFDGALAGARGTLAAASTMMSELLGSPASAAAAGELVRAGHVPRQFPTEKAEPPHPSAGDGDSEAIRVLIADDSDDLRMLCRLLLERSGAIVVGEAANGPDAIDLADACGPDVALVDLAMPGVDGLEVTRVIKERHPECRVVVFSGFEEAKVGDLCRDAGADRYLRKGVDGPTLVSTLFELRPDRPRPKVAEPARLPDDPDAAGDELLHELRTPVTVIAGLVPALIQQIDTLPAAALRELLETVARNASYLTGLLNAHTEVRQLQSGAMPLIRTPVDLRRLAQDTGEDMRPTLDGHPLRVEGEDTLWANVDPLRIRQVLVNLLSNAGKFSPAGAAIEVRVSREGDTAIIRVVNEGPSPGPGDRERLFRRFERIGAMAEGRGLGLYISNVITRAHGGTIDLEDGDADHTSFVVRLPSSVTTTAPANR